MQNVEELKEKFQVTVLVGISHVNNTSKGMEKCLNSGFGRQREITLN